MSGGACNIYIIRDEEREPGKKPTLTGFVQDEPFSRDEMFFAHGVFDPELGAMVYPVTPSEWHYFALNQTLDTARFLMWQGIKGAPFALYLGYPAED